MKAMGRPIGPATPDFWRYILRHHLRALDEAEANLRAAMREASDGGMGCEKIAEAVGWPVESVERNIEKI